MNQKLVESLAQIILSLSAEERQLLEESIQSPIAKEVKEIGERLKRFEETYQMSSERFYQKFQTGELGDSIDFFEWNTYYEMYRSAQLQAS